MSRISTIRSEFPTGERPMQANGKQRHHGTGSRREELALYLCSARSWPNSVNAHNMVIMQSDQLFAKF